MSRIALTCCFAAVLGSCGTQSAQQTDWEKARLACAYIDVDPGSSLFEKCVLNLYFSLWDEENDQPPG